MTSDGSGWRLLAPAGFTLLALAFFSFTIDDSYIALRYARNLAAGLGPVFDTQYPPREAYSSPLWVWLSAIPFLLRLSNDAAVTFVKVAGILFGAATVGLTGVLARRGSAALLVAVMPWMAFWAVSGLETPLYAMLVVGALALHRRETERDLPHAGSGAVLSLLALTRPEAVVVAAAALLAAPVARHSRREFLLAIPGLALVCVTWLGYEAWRLHYYGEFLPATFAAKAGLTIHAVRMRAAELAPFALYAAPLLVLAIARRGRENGPGPAAWGAAIALAAFAAVPRLEGAPGFRYELALLPVLAAAAAHGAGRLTPGARLALIVFLLAPLAWLRHPSQYAPSAREIAFGRWLAVYAPAARIAVYDLGAIPYYSRAADVFDTNPSGPLSPFRDERYDAGAIVGWAPSFILLPAGEGHPADPLARVSRRPDFRAAYARLADVEADGGYRFTIWKRNDEAVSPEARVALDGR